MIAPAPSTGPAAALLTGSRYDHPREPVRVQHGGSEGPGEGIR